MNDGKDNPVLERIESVHIKGFRSLADVTLDGLGSPTVLLGQNGAGKSNLMCFFGLLGAMSRLRAAEFVIQEGGADDQLFGGSKQTARIDASVSVRTWRGRNDFLFALKYTSDDQLAIVDEHVDFEVETNTSRSQPHGTADSSSDRYCATESNADRYRATESSFFFATRSEDDPRAKEVANVIGDCGRYQFHDTSRDAPIKKRWDVEDNHRLLEHGGNLAPVLLRLRVHHPIKYELICRHIRRVLPEFDDFQLDEDYGKTILRWRGRSTGRTMGAHLTSDGSLRCFCLLTLLNLPDEMLPRVILLDEPELGLHPFATSLVSHMVKSLSQRRQVIVATQSPHFVDAFGLDDIVVLEMRDGTTEAKRANEEDFSQWLDDHSSGELWWRNLLGGYP